MLEEPQKWEDDYCYNVKLSGLKDWKTVKDTLKKESGIQVHFSDAYNTVTIGANSNTSKRWHKYFSESQSP